EQTATRPTAAPQFAIVSAAAPWKPAEGMLRLSGLQVKVDPQAEWKQMYRDSIASRADLNYIFQEMLSDITVGHLRGAGGTIPSAARVSGGLLGADYE